MCKQKTDKLDKLKDEKLGERTISTDAHEGCHQEGPEITGEYIGGFD